MNSMIDHEYHEILITPSLMLVANLANELGPSRSPSRARSDLSKLCLLTSSASWERMSGLKMVYTHS